MKLLTDKHKGMRISGDGLLSRIERGERQNKGQRYSVGVLLSHLEILAREYYAGNITVVDEFCQLYCFGEEERERREKVEESEVRP